MKISTIVGVIVGFLAIFGGYLWEGGTFDSLFMLPAMLIVFGGTLAAGTAATSFEQIFRIPILFKIAFLPPRYDLEAIINQIVLFSGIARREGIMALEDRLDQVKHPYLKKLFEISIDGTDPDTLQTIVENEIQYITERHEQNIGLFVKLGGYSPTMGIIGTVMGLIATLAAAGEDVTELVRHISSAFIATMWGILMANIVWLPVGDKLRRVHEDEMYIMQVMLEGVHSVQLGETPSIIRNKLICAFPLTTQQKLLKGNMEMLRQQTSTKEEEKTD